MRTNTLIQAMIAGATGALLYSLRQNALLSFREKSVVITGGSRGLGLVLAREFARQGARLAILARDSAELERAEAELKALGAEVLAVSCDLREKTQVDDAFARIASRHGGVDVLINNAGIIQVGPLDHMAVEDFHECMAIHLFAPLYCVLASLPYMRRTGGGRIVNISSVGGKIAVPHLLPYSASKFALVGLSEGLRAELRQENIFVTTVCPGLMRTGSPRNALFKGDHQREYAWFSVSDSLPLLSMSAERAARRIIAACRRGSARLILGAHTKCAVLLNEVFPGCVSALLSAANRTLPEPTGDSGNEAWPGHQSESRWAPSILTRSGDQAARHNNEL